MPAIPRFAVLASVLLWAVSAQAHLDLVYPTSRYGLKVLKDGPCGQAGGQRSANVTVLRPGATIDVEWDEYINHPGHFRIAFDEDGDDSFEDPVCLSGCNGRSPVFDFPKDAYILADDIADSAGGTSRLKVTLPDVECDSCTLQVIQVMYDKPPYVTPGNDIYYQCADLVLSAGADAGSPPAGGGGTSPTGGAGPGASVGGGMSALGGGGVSSAEAGTPADDDADSSDEGGCTVSKRRDARGWPLATAMIAVAVTLSRRVGRARRKRVDRPTG